MRGCPVVFLALILVSAGLLPRTLGGDPVISPTVFSPEYGSYEGDGKEIVVTRCSEHVSPLCPAGVQPFEPFTVGITDPGVAFVSNPEVRGFLLSATNQDPKKHPTVCGCGVPRGGVNYRACARVKRYEQGIGANGTSLMNVETWLGMQVGPDVCVLQTVVDEYVGTEAEWRYVRGDGVIAGGSLRIERPSWFFGVRDPTTAPGHFSFNMFSMFTDGMMRYAPRPLVDECYTFGLFADFDMSPRGIDAAARAMGKEVVCGGGGGEKEGEGLFPRGHMEMCVIVGKGDTVAFVYLRTKEDHTPLAIAQASITLPTVLIATITPNSGYSALFYSCDALEGQTSLGNLHEVVRATIRFQVNPALQHYELRLVKGQYRDREGIVGDLAQNSLVAAWGY